MSSPTGVLGGLPPADTQLLDKHQLELAVAEVRFIAGADVSAVAALRLRDLLNDSGMVFPHMEQSHQGRVSVEFSAGAQPASTVQSVTEGWQLTSADGTVHVTLMPSAVSIQTTAYERWSSSLKPLLSVLLLGAADILSPSLVTRVGLRYVNRFTDASADSAAAWSGRIHPQLLGPATYPVLAAIVVGTHQQLDLRFDDLHGGVLRHGAFIDPAVAGATSYLLDVDVFDTQPSAFDAAGITERAERLNRTAASLFQSALTDEFLREMRSVVQDVDVKWGEGAGS